MAAAAGARRRRWLVSACAVAAAALALDDARDRRPGGEAALASLLALLALVALLRPTRRSTLRAGAAAGGLALGLGLAEGAARLVTDDAPSWLPLAPNMTARFEGLTIPGCAPVARFSTNELGLRSEPVPDARAGRWKLLCVGGSTTQCLFLDGERAWPALLQARLQAGGRPAWVGNAGFNGHSTRGHLLVLRRVAPRVRPDAIVVLCGINDLVLSLNDAQRAAGNGYDEADAAVGGLLQATRLGQVASRLWRVHVEEAHVERASTWNARVPGLVRGPWTPLPPDPRPLLPSLPEFRANVSRLIALARASGTPILFLTQPLRFDDGPASGGIDRPFDEAWARADRLALDGAGCWRLLQVFNAELREACAAEGVPCHDLAAEVPHDAAYFYDICHFTEAGAALVAERVHAAVLRHLAR